MSLKASGAKTCSTVFVAAPKMAIADVHNRKGEEI